MQRAPGMKSWETLKEAASYWLLLCQIVKHMLKQHIDLHCAVLHLICFKKVSVQNQIGKIENYCTALKLS